MRSNSCPKCQSAMTRGFVLDHTHGGYASNKWVEGAPQKIFWTGIKLGGRRKITIETWRCGRCGFLEQYARD